MGKSEQKLRSGISGYKWFYEVKCGFMWLKVVIHT